MRLRLSALSALPVVMALAIAPSAFAQDSGARDGFNLRGTAFSDLTSLERLQDLAEQAEAEQARAAHQEEARREAALLSVPDRPTGSATAWQQRFTMAPAGTMASVWGEQAEQFRFSAGERWGISLGISQRMRGQAFELQDVSAGAFYSLTDRVRIGGEFRFTSPEEDVFGEEADRRTPQLRFESAFRF
ncbi:hypothetical protein X907_0087 [Glycocaulis alkaliphilus]|uniref:Uncharacterized protein n=1 Tax=Glycocaulis alkaliphilus TaxID=1434191 RepID=A0A3T0E607_9PROT|nr:hypothetical protein [Glycocaulis alkaliphilus]AZU02637.1 hypothetical protein X907_0087 [Glycocaulis alkaliphilus]GGB80127.1 hypothetical protein GCM10007417_20090 [Glycocaulis alkaliphilus]